MEGIQATNTKDILAKILKLGLTVDTYDFLEPDDLQKLEGELEDRLKWITGRNNWQTIEVHIDLPRDIFGYEEQLATVIFDLVPKFGTKHVLENWYARDFHLPPESRVCAMACMNLGHSLIDNTPLERRTEGVNHG